MIDNTLKVDKSVLIHASKTKVWKSLTDPALIREYLYGAETITDWHVGSDLVFQGEYQGQPYRDKGHILENTPEQILSYDYWSSFSGIEDVPENYSTVTYTLNEENGGVRLSVRQIGFANSTNQDHSNTGWTEVLQKVKEIAESL